MLHPRLRAPSPLRHLSPQTPLNRSILLNSPPCPGRVNNIFPMSAFPSLPCLQKIINQTKWQSLLTFPCASFHRLTLQSLRPLGLANFLSLAPLFFVRTSNLRVRQFIPTATLLGHCLSPIRHLLLHYAVSLLNPYAPVPYRGYLISPISSGSTIPKLGHYLE